VFCHFDGAELRAVNGMARGADLGREFVFPSGRRCRTFDELASGCAEEWNAARNMLKQGSLRQFMAGIGRMDLALAADRAAAAADPDLGLDQFISQLPMRDGHGPRLDIEPRRFKIGPLRVGESRQVKLQVINQGMGLLHGSLQIEGDDWIRLAQDIGATVPIKTGKQQVILFNIDTFGLPAGGKFAAKLTVITNGGVVEVPVVLELQAIAFPHAPLNGAASPRELAEKIKELPKQAVPLLEAGEVQKWFTANGWRYPVQGSPARGMAGIQQLFEGMGVSKPPPVTLSDSEVLMICREGQSVRGHVTLKTSVKKWVYGRVESDSPWLTTENPDVGGAQQASIDFEADSSGLAGGRTHEGKLTVTANGGQRLTVTVRLEVRAARLSGSRSFARCLLVCGLAALLLRLLLSLPDVFARGPLQFGAWLAPGSPDHPATFVRDFTLATAWLGIPFGAILLWRRSPSPHVLVLFDVLAGMIVGGVTGLLAGATLGCALEILEKHAAAALHVRFPGSAILGWTIAGLALGFLCSWLGGFGRSFVDALGRPLAWLCQRLGLSGLGALLAGE
jgi:hypothetical protein